VHHPIFEMPISSATSHAGRQQGRDLRPVHVLHVLHGPDRFVVADLESGLERPGVLAVDAVALLDTDLEPGALGCRIVARPPQADRDVVHVVAPATQSIPASAGTGLAQTA
jgi:hypothetical protein